MAYLAKRLEGLWGQTCTRADFFPPECIGLNFICRFVFLLRFSHFVCLLLFLFLICYALFYVQFNFHILQSGSSEQTANPNEQLLNKRDKGLEASDIAIASERVREVSDVFKFGSSTVICRNGRGNLT